jgi:hypothetical protein
MVKVIFSFIEHVFFSHPPGKMGSLPVYTAVTSLGMSSSHAGRQYTETQSVAGGLNGVQVWRYCRD